MTKKNTNSQRQKNVQVDDSIQMPAIKNFHKFWSNVSKITVGPNADPVVMKEIVAAVKKYND